MSRILSAGIAMASLLFTACGTVDDSTTPSGGATVGGDGSNVTAGEESLQPGAACGGIRGNQLDCGKTAYCAYPVTAQCGAGDQQGVCTLLPDFCPSGVRYEPVCGCDGNTYDGGCNAAAAVTSVQRVGSCDQNIVGNWVYTGDRQYSYTFDPTGTFTRAIRAVCAPDVPCPSSIIESAGSYNLQGNLLNLVYTSESDQGQTAQFTITGVDPEQYLKGNDSGVAVSLTRAR